ncbi:MAG: hypothetical protein HYY01_04880 [Chloroflexi bacterium]|nr:hypothetical protein [Chloroflexota bacterium]
MPRQEARLEAIERYSQTLGTLELFHTYYWSQDTAVAREGRRQTEQALVALGDDGLTHSYEDMMAAWDKWDGAWASMSDSADFKALGDDYRGKYRAFMGLLLAKVASGPVFPISTCRDERGP